MYARANIDAPRNAIAKPNYRFMKVALPYPALWAFGRSSVGVSAMVSLTAKSQLIRLNVVRFAINYLTAYSPETQNLI
jgi:hypothetical protein